MVKAVKLTMNEIPVVKDWGDVSEVELYDPLLTPEMKDFVNEANKHGITIHAMNEEAKLSAYRHFA